MPSVILIETRYRLCFLCVIVCTPRVLGSTVSTLSNIERLTLFGGRALKRRKKNDVTVNGECNPFSRKVKWQRNKTKNKLFTSTRNEKMVE